MCILVKCFFFNSMSSNSKSSEFYIVRLEFSEKAAYVINIVHISNRYHSAYENYLIYWFINIQ